MDQAVEKLLNVKGLAEQTALPVSWWYARVEAGAVPYIRLGKYIRFRPAEIAAWLEARRVAGK